MSANISNLTLLRTELDGVRAHIENAEGADSAYRYVCEVLDRMDLTLWQKVSDGLPFTLDAKDPLERIKEWVNCLHAAVQQAWYEEQQAHA